MAQSWYMFPARIAPLYVREPLPFTEDMNIQLFPVGGDVVNL